MFFKQALNSRAKKLLPILEEIDRDLHLKPSAALIMTLALSPYLYGTAFVSGLFATVSRKCLAADPIRQALKLLDSFTEEQVADLVQAVVKSYKKNGFYKSDSSKKLINVLSDNHYSIAQKVNSIKEYLNKMEYEKRRNNGKKLFEIIIQEILKKLPVKSSVIKFSEIPIDFKDMTISTHFRL